MTGNDSYGNVGQRMANGEEMTIKELLTMDLDITAQLQVATDKRRGAERAWRETGRGRSYALEAGAVHYLAECHRAEAEAFEALGAFFSLAHSEMQRE